MEPTFDSDLAYQIRSDSYIALRFGNDFTGDISLRVRARNQAGYSNWSSARTYSL